MYRLRVPLFCLGPRIVQMIDLEFHRVLPRIVDDFLWWLVERKRHFVTALGFGYHIDVAVEVRTGPIVRIRTELQNGAKKEVDGGDRSYHFGGMRQIPDTSNSKPHGGQRRQHDLCDELQPVVHRMGEERGAFTLGHFVSSSPDWYLRLREVVR